MLEVLAKAVVVLRLQYIKVSNQHVVGLKLTQFCVSYSSLKIIELGIGNKL